jgi:AcrR family transcriptional regulator
MPRRTPAGRTADVARAACRVFIEKGYRRTLMTDVAGELGLSNGSVYAAVDSKEALFHLALLYASRSEVLDELTLPHHAGLNDSLQLVEQWSAVPRMPLLDEARQRATVDDVRAEFGAIVDERYDYTATHRRLFALIEQSAVDLPELSDLYFRRGRRALHGAFTDYLEKRIGAGALRPVPDVPTASRFVIESITWFAWHRKGDPDSAMIDDDVAKLTVRALLLAAFEVEARA